MSAPDPTADYRKYPKGPNFLLIVLLSCAAFLVILAAAVFFLHTRAGSKAVPHGPNPQPNSQVQPLHRTTSAVTV